ncbi:uncharacterized protein TNCV_4434781 [Trichonephila clavipes]|nr:uncharacterized protein TNCV_4434781 [Trichonephila clavipes]
MVTPSGCMKLVTASNKPSPLLHGRRYAKVRSLRDVIQIFEEEIQQLQAEKLELNTLIDNLVEQKQNLMFQNGQNGSAASRSASGSEKDFTSSYRLTPASRRERISTTSEKDRTLSPRPATDRSVPSVSPMQHPRSDPGPHLSYSSSSLSSNHKDKFFSRSDPAIFNAPINSEPTYPYSRSGQTLFGNLNNLKSRSLPLTPTASPGKKSSRERRVSFIGTRSSYYKERMFSPGTKSTVSSTRSSFFSLKDSNPSEALLKYKMKYESPSTNLEKTSENEVSVEGNVPTAQQSITDLETNNASMDTVVDRDYNPELSTTREETRNVPLGDIRQWRLPLSTPSGKKQPQRITGKMQPKISSEPLGNYSKIQRPETLQTNFSNRKTKFSRISTDDFLDASLKRRVALKSPNRIEPLHLNIEIAPQNISESPSGERVICGIALRMEEAAVRPRKVFAPHTPPIRKSITGFDEKRGMFTPKSVFEPKNYAIRNLFPKSPASGSPSETDYLEELEDLDRFLEEIALAPESNASRTSVKPHSTNPRRNFSLSSKSPASESPSETDYLAELEDLDRFLEDQDQSPQLTNTVDLETQSFKLKSVCSNLFPKSPASGSPSETDYLEELEDLDRFLEDQDRSPRLNNTIEWETQSPVKTGYDSTSTVSSSTNRTPPSSLETKTLNRNFDVSALAPESNASRTSVKPHSTNPRRNFSLSSKSPASESPSETDYLAELEDLDRFLEDQDQSPQLTNTVDLETQSPLNSKVFARHTPPIRKTGFDKKREISTPKSVFQPKTYAIRNLFPKSPASGSPSETDYLEELEDLDRFLEDQDRSPRLNNTIEWETQSPVKTGYDSTSTVSSSTNRTPPSSLETKTLNRTFDVSALAPEYNAIRTSIKPPSTNPRSNFSLSPKSPASESPSETDYLAELEDLDRFLEDQDRSPRLNNTIDLETQSPLNTKVFARHTPPIRKTGFDKKREISTPKSVFQPKTYAIRNLFPKSPASGSPSETDYLAELEDLDRFLEDQDRSPRLNNTIEWETQSPLNTTLGSTSTASSSIYRTPPSSLETKTLNRTCDVSAVTPECKAIQTRVNLPSPYPRNNFSLSRQENALATQNGLRLNDYASTLQSPRRHYPQINPKSNMK